MTLPSRRNMSRPLSVLAIRETDAFTYVTMGIIGSDLHVYTNTNI